jgi:hypothetical protein
VGSISSVILDLSFLSSYCFALSKLVVAIPGFISGCNIECKESLCFFLLFLPFFFQKIEGLKRALLCKRRLGEEGGLLKPHLSRC